MSHTCHARGCEVPVRPTLLMCASHWRAVPLKVQREVWQTYRPGQCDDKRPSAEWHDAASAAIGYVAIRERRGILKSEARALVRRGYRDLVIAAYVDRLGEEKRPAIIKAVAAFDQEPAR